MKEWNKSTKESITSILFCADEEMVKNMQNEVFYSADKEQDVVLTNERVIVSNHNRKLPDTYDIIRPATSVLGHKV